MNPLTGLIFLAFLSQGCHPTEQREEARLKKAVKRSERKQKRESREHSSMGTNESSVTD